MRKEAWMSVQDGVLRDDGAIVFEEFEESDPRRVISLEAQAEAGAFMTAEKRWHRRRYGVDWFAVQLQFGRGFTGRDVAKQFRIGDSTISSRQDEEHWVRPMSERDRRRLSQYVWLAGIWRGAGDEAESREALKAWSEWRLPEEAAPLKFKLLDAKGAPATAAFNQEIPDDIYYSPADPQREDRFAMRRQLDEIIAGVQRDVAERHALRDGDLGAQEVAGYAPGAEESTAAGEALDTVGASEPASA
jgi:hypothetical protein